MMKVLFMGTPEFAAESLRALLQDPEIELVGVFTQPDKPQGRGMSVAASPVKQLAEENGVRVFQPEKMRDGTALEIIRTLDPDILVVVAFGRILPDDILAIPRLGAVNIHASLLPRYRGSSPIQWAVLNGDEVTGVTSMYLAHDMDAGDVIYSETTPIGMYETAGELSERLKVMGAKLLIRTLHDIENGSAPRTPQDHDKATYVSMLDKSISAIDWSKSSAEIIHQVYGLQPWPVAVSSLGDMKLKIFAAEYSDQTSDCEPGTILSADSSGILVVCGDGNCIRLTEIQAPGKRRVRVADFLNGHRIPSGTVLC